MRSSEWTPPPLTDEKGTKEVFECGCGKNIHGSKEITRHFTTCYEIFRDYGSVMKAFLFQKSKARGDLIRTMNLFTLLQTLLSEIEQSLAPLGSIDFIRESLQKPMKLPVPGNHFMKHQTTSPVSDWS